MATARLDAISSLRNHVFDVVEGMSHVTPHHRQYGVVRELQRIAFELGQVERMVGEPSAAAMNR